MNAPELIRKKRNGGKLTKEEINFMVNGYLSGSVAEYQMSAFLMAVYFRKMDFEETSYYTDVILHSGHVLDLSAIPGVKVDKHSTGGVGDKVSIILGPMAAACGVVVPMISGRGLGHTGGTLDKLQSIPGYRADLSVDDLKKVLAKTGIVIMGQTSEIAPADKRLYALRDVTATVESMSLVAGSIMSKKIAEGIDALVLDIKTGKGAIMQSRTDGEELAKMFIGIGKQFSKKILCFITDMEQPLGYTVGNWLEIVECIECLKGKDVPDLMEVTYALGGAMVMLAGKAPSIDEGIKKCRKSIEDGSAWKKFLEMVEAQGGERKFMENPALYAKSKFSKEIRAPQSGFIQSIDALEFGLAANMLGVGRMKVDDIIDPKAGVILAKKIGDPVRKDELLATCYADDKEKLDAASKRIEGTYQFSGAKPAVPRLIHCMIDDRGVREWNQGN